MTRIVAGCICLALGLVFWIGYDADDYRHESAYQATTPAESVRIQRDNVAKRQERDLHRISIAVCLVMGALMVIDGQWRRRRQRADRQGHDTVATEEQP